jgi:hypothetical protein
MPGKGYINFLVESADKVLQIVKDFSIDNNSAAGTLKVDLPQAGNYVLTVVSKYKSAVQLSITTNGNYFYKNGAFLGNKTESYKAEMASLPGFFYIPDGLNKVYCNVNSFSGGKYSSEDAVTNSFAIKDHNGNLVQFHFVTPKDSSLMYLEIPEDAAGTFWQATNMTQYSLQFINIGNLLWYATKTAKPAKGTAAIVEEKAVTAPMLYPNPSTGVFNCMRSGTIAKADEIIIYNTQGAQVSSFKNAQQFNISSAAAGLYVYRMVINGEVFKGKLIKL